MIQTDNNETKVNKTKELKSSGLIIKDLHVEVEGKEILKGINLTFHSGKVHALMGPNGSGKSTLAQALMGHPKYKITKGQILLDGKDITKEKTHLRAQAGLFLSFQYPSEINGVTISNFLRTAVKAVLKKDYNVLEFHKLLKEKMELLHMDHSFCKRYLNVGFSGGEKKRAEILQMLLLEPKYALLDETDSGVDVDSLKNIAESINAARKISKAGMIVITHYNRFLEYFSPDEVSVLYQGKVIAQGGYELAKKIEQEGFKGIIKDDQDENNNNNNNNNKEENDNLNNKEKKK